RPDRVIAKTGPDRVIINDAGEGIPPDKALKMEITPDIIFIRNDGWSLGAPQKFESIAHKMWEGDWEYFVRFPEKMIRSITEYE
ncbi:hypothetical protein LCGC14_1415050, partial [marine sediment metagenome]